MKMAGKGHEKGLFFAVMDLDILLQGNRRL
jgi:hypothetical protein